MYLYLLLAWYSDTVPHLGIELNRLVYFTIRTEYIGYIEMNVYHDPSTNAY
jgi:hypothetical protein